MTKSGKIAQDAKRHIVWIWDSERVKRYLSKPHLKWNKKNKNG